MGFMLDERQSVTDHFRDLTDDCLLETYGSGSLTPLALEVAGEELTRRGIAHSLPAAAAETVAPCVAEAAVILETVARSLETSRLEILRARLEAEGIPAFVFDGNTNQAYSFISPAMGGARLQVPCAFAAEARELIAAIDSGKLTANSRDVDETN